MQNDNQVQKIIEYLQGKIHNIKEKLRDYENPIMQDMAKNSPHLQMDYIRLSTELQANEDNLLAIQTFTAPQKTDDGKKEIKPSRKKAG